MTILYDFKDLKDISLKDIELIMWDMDGTIVSTEKLHAQAVYEMTLSKKIDIPKMEELFCGQADEVVYKKLKNDLPHKDIESFSLAKTKVFKDLIIKESKSIIAPEILHYFNFIKTKNIQMALVTSSQKEVMNLIFDILGLDQYFSFKRAFEDNQNNKPSPEPYLSTLAQAKIDKDKAIIFEDSAVGLIAARATGVKKVYAVKWYS